MNCPCVNYLPNLRRLLDLLEPSRYVFSESEHCTAICPKQTPRFSPHSSVFHICLARCHGIKIRCADVCRVSYMSLQSSDVYPMLLFADSFFLCVRTLGTCPCINRVAILYRFYFNLVFTSLIRSKAKALCLLNWLNDPIPAVSAI